MIKEAIAKVVEQKNLTLEEARQTMEEIMSGQCTDAQIASFVTALRMKGETVEEITGCAMVMREKVTRIQSKHKLFVDTCGTGGDRKGTFNVSTCAAFVVAGAGVPVAKHGNRAATSSCGSADVLKVLGVKIDCDPSVTERCLNEIGICFLFAPQYHGSMKFALPTRQQIGIRTLFNIMGPLTNPAGAPCQAFGVYNPDLADIMIQVLKNLGSHHALACHGIDGLDEITISGDTKVVELKNGKIMDYYIEPKDFGFPTAKLEEIHGGTPEDNAQMIVDILSGKDGARRHIVLMNAGAAILATDVAETLSDGVIKAAKSLDSGAAKQKLEELKKLSNSN